MDTYASNRRTDSKNTKENSDDFPDVCFPMSSRTTPAFFRMSVARCRLGQLRRCYRMFVARCRLGHLSAAADYRTSGARCPFEKIEDYQLELQLFLFLDFKFSVSLLDSYTHNLLIDNNCAGFNCLFQPVWIRLCT